jgi:hypothetical protein
MIVQWKRFSRGAKAKEKRKVKPRKKENSFSHGLVTTNFN